MVETLDETTIAKLRIRLALAEASQEILREHEAEIKERAKAKYLAMTGQSLNGGDSGKEPS